MKTCNLCGNEYPATREYFYRDRSKLHSRCKKCFLAKQKEWREAHKEQVAATWHNWYIRNKDRHTENCRKWESENPERVRELKNRYNETPIGQENRRKQSHHRRVRKYGTNFEDFSGIDIFERDNWQCSICGGKVSPKLGWPDPMSSSLDHIIPLSRGGNHTRDNVCCSHLQCNVSKNRYSVEQQLLLFG